MIVDTLNDQHQTREWTDIAGRRWAWSAINGWVVDGIATFGGHDPDGHGPFSDQVS